VRFRRRKPAPTPAADPGYLCGCGENIVPTYGEQCPACVQRGNALSAGMLALHCEKVTGVTCTHDHGAGVATADDRDRATVEFTHLIPSAPPAPAPVTEYDREAARLDREVRIYRAERDAARAAGRSTAALDRYVERAERDRARLSPPPPPPAAPADTWSASCGGADCGWVGPDRPSRDAAKADQDAHADATGHRSWTAGEVEPGMAITNPMTDGTAANPSVLDVATVERVGDGMVRVTDVNGVSVDIAADWPVAPYTREQADLEATVVAEEQDRHSTPPADRPPPATPAAASTPPPALPPAGGADMSSINEVRTGIAQATEQATEAMNALQQAYSLLERAHGTLTRATEGSGQVDVADASEMLVRAVTAAIEAQQAASAAVKVAEGIAGRL
jgi:hypothetical protein